MPRSLRVPHTFTVANEVKVASGDDNYIPPFFVPVPSGQRVALVGMRHRINSGTSVSIEIHRNGVLATGFSASATTTSTTTDPANVALADNDTLALVVTAVSGTPKNLTVSVFLEYKAL